MLGDDDATFKPQAFAELLLPEPYRLWIREWGEDVIENHLRDGGSMLVHKSILNPHLVGINPLYFKLLVVESSTILEIVKGALHASSNR